MNTKNYLKNRISEIEAALVWSAVVFDNFSLDGLALHVEERLELLRERLYLMSLIRRG
jgi:hypothetical protein